MFYAKKMSYAGCPGPSPAISVQFTFIMCVTARNHKKITKTVIFGVQGHSRSLPLTPIKSLLLLLVTISRTSLPICNRLTLHEIIVV